MANSKPKQIVGSPSFEALFRFNVISQVLALVLAGWVRLHAAAEVSSRSHFTVDGVLRRVSARTIMRWIVAYESGGISALEPAPRRRTQTSMVLPSKLVEFLQSEKEKDPRTSLPEVVRRARERHIIGPDTPVDRTTLWRAARRLGVTTRRRPAKNEADSRRFAYPNRMMMILCDGKHFRAGAGRLRRVALFYLDDATRRALHAVVGPAECTELFLRGLYDVISKHGYMDVVYLDRGPGFQSHDTSAVIAAMPHTHLILGQRRYPQGHGKIERFNRTAFAAVLRSLDRAAEVDPDPGALSLRLQHFCSMYNDRPHESLHSDTPRNRWEQDQRALRFPADEAELKRYFVVHDKRRVSNDHVIQYGGRLFEAPHGLRGEWVEVHRQVLDGRLFVPYRGKLTRIHELDLAANARDRRARTPEAGLPSPDEATPKTAAHLAFDHMWDPLTASDGGFSDPKD